MTKCTRSFFTRPSLAVAKDILGKYIVHRVGRKKLIGKIIETEAYPGPYDKASHAFGGKITERNRAEYRRGGHIYIYLVYGMYWQFNISTGEEGYPECILIRAIEIAPLKIKMQKSKCKMTDQNLKLNTLKNKTNGPGKLCNYLQLDKRLYGVDLCKSKEIWIEDQGEKIKKSDIKSAKRINIDYAGPKWANKKWRFFVNLKCKNQNEK